jgi:predicted GNAT family N-acyltransferase
MRIERADWDSELPVIKAIRQQVFIEEQSVPADLEWDGKDDSATHWLAWQDGKAVATVRLLHDGHLGRMAVLADYRGNGIGRRLLKAVIDTAAEQQLLEVYLYAQLHALSFYSAAGFIPEGDEFLDAGIAHRTMRLRISEQRLLGIHGGKFAIRQLDKSVLALIGQVDRQLRILSFDLDQAIYGQANLVEAVSRFARKSRFSDIKILICRSDSLTGRGHPLVQLQQRLSSIIQLRKVRDDAQEIKNNLIVADNLGVICQSIKEPEIIWGNFNNRPIAEDCIAQFDRLWNRARPDPNLKPVSL